MGLKFTTLLSQTKIKERLTDDMNAFDGIVLALSHLLIHDSLLKVHIVQKSLCTIDI